MTTYSGTMIKDLQLLTAQVMILEQSGGLAEFLQGAMDQLKPGAFSGDPGDRAAFIICERIRECLLGDLPVPNFIVCFVCGRPYEIVANPEFVAYLRTNFICGPCDGDC